MHSLQCKIGGLVGARHEAVAAAELAMKQLLLNGTSYVLLQSLTLLSQTNNTARTEGVLANTVALCKVMCISSRILVLWDISNL